MTVDSSQFQTVGNQLIGSGNKQTTAGSGSSWVQKAHQVIAASKQSLVNAAPVLDSMDGAVKSIADAADPFTPVVDSAAAMQNGDFTGVALEGSELATKKFRIVNDIWSWVKNTFSKFRGGNDATKRVPDDAFVVRGGADITPESIVKGTGTHPSGVTGFSAQCNGGTCLTELGANVRHNQMGVTTAGQIRKAGGDVVVTSGKGNHVIVTNLKPNDASSLLSPSVPNPVPKSQRNF